ncbi:unnamed protein product [Cylindrotheca closterium]|uniref:SET domain-containing protein n=1 Tax=Cylindrotheca closterium TaxID=2856 RepID=A0AAD2JQ98_9STRA|nr:unnamed protein product [Cylindrotheca closterium]
MLYSLPGFVSLLLASVSYLSHQALAAEENLCRVVLAESSIPEAGLGVYALQDYDLGDPIGPASIAIPWIDNVHIFNNNNNNNTTITESQHHHHQKSLLNYFLLDAAGIGGFGEAMNVSLFIPGLASLVQHHTYLDNVMISGTVAVLGSKKNKAASSADRHVSVMAGSETAYYNVQLTAKKSITKGQELFLYPPSKHLESKHPKRQAYQMAEDLVQKLGDYYNDSNDNMSITPAQWTDLLYRIRMDVMEDSETAQLLPKSLYELKLAIANNSEGLVQSRLQSRSVDWIAKHGSCLDNIGMVENNGASSLAANTPTDNKETTQRSAIATRFLPKGSVIVETPMVPIDPELMKMKPNHDKNHADSNNNTRQLLWNYCFGHRHATTQLLLCPTTAAAMMNHPHSHSYHDDNESSFLLSNKKSPNVGLRWKEPNAMLHGSLQDFWLTAVNRKNLLVMEFVALRDIAEHEELLLDYGSEWQEAYQSHVNENTSTKSSITMLSTHNDQGIQTENYSNQPKELVTECFVYPQLKADAQLGDWQDFYDSNQMMIHRKTWPLELQKLYPKEDEFASWYPCKVVEDSLNGSNGSNGDDSYSVLIFAQHLHDETVVRRFRGFPKDRLRLVSAPYHSDQHLPWAFRQLISIPDEIFPLRWRNDYKPASSWNLGVVEDGYLTDRSKLEEQQQAYERALREVDCGLYMGVSNIPNSGYGMYAGADIPFSQLVVGSTIPEVPVDNYKESHWPGTEYVWNSFGLAENPESPSVLRGLFGSIANSHNGVINMVSPKIQNSPYDPMLDRRKDPGAGAFSPYVENTFLSGYPIKAGEELFVTYGEHWFRNRKEYDTVPLLQHFRRADNILASILSMMTLEGASLFHADFAFRANQDKFNISFHGQLQDVLGFCQMDGIKGQLDTTGASKVINLSRKNDRMNRMPSSIIARMDPKDIPHESYEGISYDAEEFGFSTMSGASAELPCRVLASDASTGLFEVLVFFADNDKRQLLRYPSFDANRLEFRIPPNKGGLSSLLGLLRNHFLKELDDVGLTTESFRRFKTALSNIDSVQDITTVLNRNGTAMATTKRRSKEWLEDNGICLDHVYVNRSTITNAGNGAFARRPLTKNTIIIGSPMLATSRDHKLLTMVTNASRKSLILNYHYGHKDSSVLFFPNSHAIAINHNSPSMPNGKPANARVQFSTKDKKSRYLVHRPLRDIEREKYSSLVMEVVAIRDIAPDEEIFVDYGKEWEAAWNEHVQSWKDPCQNANHPCYKSSISIWKMNQDKFNIQYHAWSEDHLTYCTIPQAEYEGKKDVKKVVLHLGDSYLGVPWDHDGFQVSSYRDNSGDRVFPCLVIESDEGNSKMQVAIFDNDSSTNGSNESATLVLRHWKYFSHSWVSFRPRQFKGDSMNPLAFRHEIGTPNDVFPEHWKDLLE